MRWVKLFSILSVGLILFVGCSGFVNSDLESINPVVETPVESDSLLIYCEPSMVNMLHFTAAIFKKEFPDVNLELRQFGNPNDPESYVAFFETLTTDLSAGKGPDVIVSFHTFPDIHKVARSGVFENLDAYMEKDSTFLEDDFFQGVMDGGIINGERLFVPLDFWANIFVSSEETMNAFDVHFTGTPTFAQWHDTMQSFFEDFYYTGQSFTNLVGTMNEFTLLKYSGVHWMDYETGEIRVRTEEFRQLMEMAKVLYNLSEDTYSDDWEHWFSIGGGKTVKEIMSQDYLFACAITPREFVELYAGLMDQQTPVHYSFPHTDETALGASAMHFAAVNSTSKNKDMAYEFIKIMLSEEVQTNDYFAGFPVRKSSLALSLNKLNAEYANRSVPDGSVIFQTISENVISSFIDEMDAARYTSTDSELAAEIIIEGMTAYFKSDRSYDACLDEVENKLSLYVFE